MTRAAWIGLGAMGSRMARRLADAGHDLTVWDRTPSRAAALAAVGAKLAAIPADAARDTEVVFLMLGGPAALTAVTEGPAGVLAGISPGTTLVDMSTVSPVAATRLRSLLPERVTMLDVPVVGGLTEAETGKLTLLAGGPGVTVAELRPMLSTLGAIVHVGIAGAGAAAGLVANLVLLGTVGLLGQALSITDALGLPRTAAWQVLALTPLAAQADRHRPASDDLDYGSDDLDYAAVIGHIAASTGTAHPGGAAARITADGAPHYSWGEDCDGWRLLDTSALSVIEERMPPGTAETWHLHRQARQFFYTLDGQATMRTVKEEIRLPAGSGVHIPPGAPHQMTNSSDQDVRFLVISTPNTKADRQPYTTAAPRTLRE